MSETAVVDVTPEALEISVLMQLPLLAVEGYENDVTPVERCGDTSEIVLTSQLFVCAQ
jgi:hypothetical protein